MVVSVDPAALSARVQVSRAPTARRGIPARDHRAMCAPTRANSRHDGRSDAPVYEYTQLSLQTKLGISLHDITPQVRAAIRESGVSNGTVNVLSRHTTTAVTINEAEDRLMDDIRQYMLKLAPPGGPNPRDNCRPSRARPDPGPRVLVHLRSNRDQEAGRIVQQRPRLQAQVPRHQEVQRRVRHPGQHHRQAAGHEVALRRQLRDRRRSHRVLAHLRARALHGRQEPAQAG